MDSVKKIFISIIITLNLAGAAFPNVTANQPVQLPKIIGAPIIDGKLDDAAWSQALVFTDFKTIQPDYGLPPSEKTEAFLGYDQENMYIAFRCHDQEADKIKAAVSRRDNPGNDDWIAFCLDTFNDELSAYFFMVNPLGIQADGTLDANAEPDITLDLVWTSAGSLTPEGFCAEIAIPFKSIRFPAREKLVMGIKIARMISRKSEEVDFPEYHPDRGAALAQFQKIELAGIQTRRLVELLPTAIASKKFSHQYGKMVPVKTDTDFSLTSKFGITSNLIIDATYNPDFSQVETDAGQVDVNLRYALYYPEKRSFFLEGQEWLKFGANFENAPLGAVVHTRTVVDPVLGLKLTGKIREKNLLSAIYALDQYQENNQIDKCTRVTIIRYGRRLQNDSYLGTFYTGRSLTGTLNHVFGSDGRLRLSNNSYMEYHGFGSFIKNMKLTRRRDGSAMAAIYTYNTRRLYLLVGLDDVSKNFNTEVGYLQRTGVTLVPIYLQYNIFPACSWLQRIEPYYWARHGKDHTSGRYESFNVLSLRFLMPRQTMTNIQGWLANEVFAGKRFSRNACRMETHSQPFKQVFLACDVRHGNFIYYESANPYSGSGTQVYFSILLQPTGKLSSGLEINYSDFYRDEDNQKIYDYTIYRNRTVFQVNKYLFFRKVLEYNSYWKRLNADFLISFTYIPGTVVYFGYGSIYEKITWRDQDYQPGVDYLLTKKNWFFKASYLWRL